MNLSSSAEQLLREAKERQLEIVAPPPRQKITDPTELAEYRMRKRKGFEDNIRKNRYKKKHVRLEYDIRITST